MTMAAWSAPGGEGGVAEVTAALVGSPVEAAPLSGVGAVVAIVLLASLRVLLPRSEHRQLRGPVQLFVVHVVFSVAAYFTTSYPSLHKPAYLVGLLSILICIGRAGFVLVADSVVSRRLARPLPKIFRDILLGLIYLAAVLVTLRAAGAELDALLTTSALLTAVLGLSMQDTLGNLFAGLSLQAQRPFEVGDWIQLGDGRDMIGRVVEINWRATKVITLEDVEVVIPNGPLAKAPIHNFTKPTRVSRRAVAVVIGFDVAPRQVHRVLLEAVRPVGGVSTEPAPSVVTVEFGERGVKYSLRYWVADFAAREVIDGEVRDRVWYALRRAGYDIAVPVHDVEVRNDDEEQRRRSAEQARARRRRVLTRVDFLAALEAPQLDALANVARQRPYAPDEIIVRQGERGDEFFVVARGEVAVSVEDGGYATEVARLGPGSFFGEMSVMTGEPRTATVHAVGDVEIVVLDKQAFAPILDAAPEAAARISEVLAARREQLGAATSRSKSPVAPDAQAERSTQLLGRIREFFSL
jgi:small-conductance mechanosensitive channel/CRP-like cAMP-binding protein